MKNLHVLAVAVSLFFGTKNIHAQFLTGANFSGSFETKNQLFRTDNNIGATVPNDKIGSNNYLKLDFSKGIFVAGMRYEAYLPVIFGYSPLYNGNKIVNRFFGIRKDEFELTVGNFYEQFGSGLVFRAYEDRQLGIDNSVDGVSIKFNIIEPVTIKAIYGKQRLGMETGNGIIRGIDAELDVFGLLKSNTANYLSVSGSLVSRYEAYTGGLSTVPENVTAYSARFDFVAGNFGLNSEYVQKSSDPHLLNKYSYRKGRTLLINSSYSLEGMGMNVNLRRTENMDFRAEREAVNSDLLINYVPGLSKQHKYSVLNLYPYAVQSNNEIGGQIDFYATVPKGTFLGKNYGTLISANFSTYYEMDTIATTNAEAFNSDFFAVSKTKYFHDFNVEIEKKWSKKLKTTLTYANIYYNKTKLEGEAYEIVKSNSVVADFLYLINEKNSLRVELSHLATKTDYLNWVGAMVEYGVAPYFTCFVSDLYNYQGNKRAHYYNTGFAISKGDLNFSLRYGRQKKGVLCVGGVCTQVPAFSGFVAGLTVAF